MLFYDCEIQRTTNISCSEVMHKFAFKGFFILKITACNDSVPGVVIYCFINALPNSGCVLLLFTLQICEYVLNMFKYFFIILVIKIAFIN